MSAGAGWKGTVAASVCGPPTLARSDPSHCIGGGGGIGGGMAKLVGAEARAAMG